MRERDLTYSYLTLTRRARSLAELSDARELYRAVSGQLRSKGKREVWLCGRDSAPRAQRLDRHASEENAGFEAAERGSVISLESAEHTPRSGLLRVQKGDRIGVVQAWDRE